MKIKIGDWWESELEIGGWEDGCDWALARDCRGDESCSSAGRKRDQQSVSGVGEDRSIGRRRNFYAAVHAGDRSIVQCKVNDSGG